MILVDANLLVSDARALAARLSALRKPLLAAFVTHAHPDHFNGLPYVAGDDVPVYATAAVAETIAEIAVPKREQWRPLYGDEWPDRHRVPDHPPARRRRRGGRGAGRGTRPRRRGEPRRLVSARRLRFPAGGLRR
nr:hypothetical protein GCM10020093_054850 [Planobispora longispora]